MTEVTEARLRDDLYAHCRDEGIVDEIKSKIRAQLIARLNARTWSSQQQQQQRQQHVLQDSEAETDGFAATGYASVEDEGTGRAGGAKPSSALWERVTASLFCDYLRSSALQYTLSVFKPEVGARRKVAELTRDEVLSVLNLDGSTPLGRRIEGLRSAGAEADAEATGTAEALGDTSLAVALFESLAQEQRRVAGSEAATQTWTVGEATLASQLSTIDDRFRAKARRESKAPYELLEERMHEYRKECDARVAAEVDLRTRRVREVELAAVRAEEAARYRALADDLRTELEEENNARSLSLQRREDASMASLRAKEARIEASAYEHRQRMLAEREDLARVRESQRKEELAFAERIRTLEERVARREEDVCAHERDIEAMRERGVGAADEVLVQRRAQMESEHREKLASHERERAKLQEDRSAALDARSLAEADLARSSIDRRRAEVAERAAMEADERCIAVREELLALRASTQRARVLSGPDNDDGQHQEEAASDERDRARSLHDQLESARRHNSKLKRALQQALGESESAKAATEKDLMNKLRQWQQRALAAEKMLETAIDARDAALTDAEDLRLELRKTVRAAGIAPATDVATKRRVDSARVAFDISHDDEERGDVEQGDVSEEGDDALLLVRPSALAAYVSEMELERDKARADNVGDDGDGGFDESIDAEIERRLKALEEEEHKRSSPARGDRHTPAAGTTAVAERRAAAAVLNTLEDVRRDELTTPLPTTDGRDRGGEPFPSAVTTTPVGADTHVSVSVDAGVHTAMQIEDDSTSKPPTSTAPPLMGRVQPGATAVIDELGADSPSSVSIVAGGTHRETAAASSVPALATTETAAATETVTATTQEDSASDPSQPLRLSRASPVRLSVAQTGTGVEEEDREPEQLARIPHEQTDHEKRVVAESLPSRRQERGPSSAAAFPLSSATTAGPSSSRHGVEEDDDDAIDDEDDSCFHGVSIIEKCEDDDGEGVELDSSIVRGVHDELAHAVSRDEPRESATEERRPASESMSRRLEPLVAEHADEVEERLGSPSIELQHRVLDPDPSDDSIGRLEVLPPDLPELEDEGDDAEFEAIDYEDIPADDDDEGTHGHHPFAAGGSRLDMEMSAGSFGQPPSEGSEGSVF